MASHPVDVHVGLRIRERRRSLNLTQRAVGNAIGLTFQQVQKYEYGSNRIGSSRLYEFAKVLDVPISYFFERMPAEALNGSARLRRNGFGDVASPFADGKDPLTSRETRELVDAYYQIREVRLRRRVYELLRTAGDVSAGGKAAKEKHPGKRAGKQPRTTRSRTSRRAD